MLVQIKEVLNNREVQKQAQQVASSINECLQIPGSRVETQTLVSAYTLYKARTSSKPFSMSYSEILNGKITVNDEILIAIREYIPESSWEMMSKLLPKYAPDIFAAIVFFPLTDSERTDGFTTPECVVDLAQHLLQFHNGEQIADIGCGTGTFIINTQMKVSDAEFIGYEINSSRYYISIMRAELLGKNITIYLQDVFELVNDSEEGLKFDKIFSNYPFSVRLRNLGSSGKYFKQLEKKYPDISKSTSSDWVFNGLLCDLLKEGGKAVGIMTNGSTWNGIDLPMRKHFVEAGLVECVIALPAKMFGGTSIPTSMIVLSRGNQSVRLVDASEIYQQGRRQNEFSIEDIKKIVAATQMDGENSKLISLEELQENEYSLNLSRYRGKDIQYENGVVFESVIQNITRGASCTASQLDEMVSERKTNMQFLMLSNIHNGLIDDNLPYLKEIGEKFEKYCVKNNSLILSKNGVPFKIAVATVQEEQKVLANGNLYVIELIETKANPYYLKAFLESEQGIAALKRIAVGTTITSIGVDKLKKLIIPLPSIEEQNRIAARYLAILDEISTLKLRIESAFIQLKHILDDHE